MKTFETNATTGKTIERDLTKEELAQIVIDTKADVIIKAELAAKATAKASGLAKLAALGLTDDEIKSLLGGS